MQHAASKVKPRLAEKMNGWHADKEVYNGFAVEAFKILLAIKFYDRVGKFVRSIEV